MIAIAFFQSKGGVGRTWLTYHLGWRFADLGKRVLLVDLDPQATLTAMCVDEERLGQLWGGDDRERKSMRGALQPIIDGVGDVQLAHQEPLDARLALVPGDIRLIELEQKLWEAWPRCMDRDPAAFRIASSFYRVIQAAAREHNADIVLVDVGPNAGAINRSALIAVDYVVTPLLADLLSNQSLMILGSTLVRWREEWRERLAHNPVPSLPLPDGSLKPLGYVVTQLDLFRRRPTRAYERWLQEIPKLYATSVLHRPVPKDLTIADDMYCLAVLKHYRSLIPMAQAAGKPIFKLTAADGAIGAHAQVVCQAGADFRDLAQKMLDRLASPP